MRHFSRHRTIGVKPERGHKARRREFFRMSRSLLEHKSGVNSRQIKCNSLGGDWSLESADRMLETGDWSLETETGD